MFVVRLIGYLLLLTGLVVLGAELLHSLEAGTLSSTPLGQRWVEYFGFPSIQAIQAGLQRHLLPFLWDPVVQSIFETSVWVVSLVLIALGTVIILIARRRRRRRFG